MLPAVVLALAVAIAVGVFFYLTGPTVEEIQGNVPSPTASAETADLRVDGVLFRVPANYTKYRRSRYSGDHEDVPMHALLPNLSPWSPGDAAAFASNAPNARVIHFTLTVDRGPLTYEQKFDRGIRPAAENEAGEPGPFGLTQYKFGPGTNYEHTEWFTAKLDNGTELVMRCDASANPDFGSSCMRVTRLPDNVSLTYKFKRTHLAQWKQIEAGVMGLVDSFRPKK